MLSSDSFVESFPLLVSSSGSGGSSSIRVPRGCGVIISGPMDLICIVPPVGGGVVVPCCFLLGGLFPANACAASC